MDDEEIRAPDWRTRNATARLMRQREARAADLLAERGWTGLTTPAGQAWPDPEYVEGKKPRET